MLEINKIYNIDAVEGLKQIPDKSIDLIVTDPPYPTTKRGISKNTTTGGLVRSELGKKGKIFHILSDGNLVEYNEFMNCG